MSGSPLTAFDRVRGLVYHTLLAAAALLILTVSAGLQLGQRDYYRLQSDQNRVQPDLVPARRGTLFDRHGQALARDHTTLTAVYYADRVPAGGLPRLLAQIAALAEVPPEQLTARAAAEARRRRPYEPRLLLANLTPHQLARLAAGGSELPALAIVPAYQREYPHGELAAHLLGYLNELTWDEYRALKDSGYRLGGWLGRTGTEQAAEALLHGSDGLNWLEIDSRQRAVRVLTAPEPVPPADGAAVYLTLDLRLQQAAEAAFPPGRRGAVVALDPRSGAVRVLVSRPGYDPNAFAARDTARVRAYLNDPARALLNRAIAGQYPAGSTFKIIDALAALMDERFTPATRFSCGGALALGATVFHCWSSGGHGSLGMIDAIRQSCNVYFYQLGIKLGPDAIAGMSRQLGLGALTGIQLVGEAAGLVPDRAWKARQRGLDPEWKSGDSANLAIGQGALQVTPLQMAVAFAAVANGGRIYRPQLIERAVRPDGGELAALTPDLLRTVTLSPAALATVRAGMQQAIVAGTGRQAATFAGGEMLEQLPAGKTGTAQVGDLNGNGRIDESEQPHAWFVAYWPVSDPQLAIAVFVEHGGYGGAVAAPVARRVFAVLDRPGADGG